VWSSGTAFVNPQLKYTGEGNRFQTQDPFRTAFGMKLERSAGWKLVAHVPASMLHDDRARALLVSLKSAALQFGHAGLQVSLTSDGDAGVLADDWSLSNDGIGVESRGVASVFSLALVSPQNETVKEWHDNPGPADLGLALRQTVGPPVFGYLDIDKVAAH
jgi:hypothetical protein